MSKISGFRKIISLVAGLALLALAAFGIWLFVAPGPAEADIYFLGLNNADCTLIKWQSAALLIDTGEERDRSAVLKRLSELEVSSIDLMILTHPDKDHIGNAEAVLRSFEVKRVMMPACEKGSGTEKALYKALSELEVPVTKPIAKTNINLSGLRITVLPGEVASYKQINDHSLVAFFSCAGKTVFMGGDIESKRIGELLARGVSHADIVKLPHHGRAEKNSGELIAALSPQIAVVTAERAEEKVQSGLEQCGASVYFTARGEVWLRLENQEVKVMS